MDLLLGVNDVLHPCPDMDFCEWREAEACAAGLDSWRNFVDIVADDAKTDVLSSRGSVEDSASFQM